MLQYEDQLVAYIDVIAEYNDRPVTHGGYILYDAQGKYRYDCVTEKPSTRRFDTIDEAIAFYRRFIEHKGYVKIKMKELWRHPPRPTVPVFRRTR